MRPHDPPSKPNFFIVGAPKCGTTAMSEYLGTHPDIYFSEVKEPHYFGSDFQARRFLREGGMAAYLDLFRGASNETRIGEASIFYLYSHYAARELHAFDPNAKIIILLRNPVDMLYSYYYELRFQADEPLESFEQALDAEAERKQGQNMPVSLLNMPESLYYRDVASYTDQIQRYFDVFGREAVHVIIFDDFKQNTTEVYRDTLVFLGVDPSFQPDFKVVNANKVLRNSALRRFLHTPPRWWYRGPVAMARLLLPFRLRHKVNLWLYRLNTRTTPRPPMNLDTRRRLQAEFRPEVERLSALLGRDLTHWCETKS